MNTVLPELYTASQTRDLDRLAIDRAGIPGFTLMTRAAEATYHQLELKWPACERLAIFCGVGNNGGDGYLIARIAKAQGMFVQVYQLGNTEFQTGDALLARQSLEETSIHIQQYEGQTLQNVDVIVDAILGTGLERNVEGLWLSAIQTINHSPAKVVAVDIPSGLHADTGCELSEAVQAELTVTFIGRKLGLFTAEGRACAGEVVFNALEIPAKLFKQVKSNKYLLPKKLSHSMFNSFMKPRALNSHKGVHGHVLVIGGGPGMNGAVMMAAVAALRSGCGLVSVATHPTHASQINLLQPEIMSHGIQSAPELKALLDRADAIVLGPGLGKSSWAEALFQFVVRFVKKKDDSNNKLLIVDADGLNLLAQGFGANEIERSDDWILTPHPGEAGRLLACKAQEVQNDRYVMIENLQNKYGGICVLKGAGTLLSFHDEIRVCQNGNPGMASAGMGDILSGVLGSVVSQRIVTKETHSLKIFDAVSFAVNLHACAGDAEASKNGEKGLLATDLLPHLRRLINRNLIKRSLINEI